MNVTDEQIPQAQQPSSLTNGHAAYPIADHRSPITERRHEIDAKQEQVAALIAEAGVDGMLILDPANVAWISGAALCHGVVDPGEWPALFFLPAQRWLLCANTDTQRLFDLHLDGLGFQLKEWPWHWGRDRLLADLCANRKVAADRVVTDCVPVGPTLRRLRCTLTPAEQARVRDLGAKVAHAVEATGRTLERGQCEAEVAGQLAHRLVHRGLTPVQITVAGDGRLDRHRRAGVSPGSVERTCVLAATAMAGGLHATVARTVSFGEPPPEIREAHEVACRVLAAQASAARPGVTAPEVLLAGRRIAQLSGGEHEWRQTPPGWVTGWLSVERPVVPTAAYSLGDGWATVWQAGIGPALVADTFLVTDPPSCITPIEIWPAKRINVGGCTFDIADILNGDE
ncbi:MAG: M24 family metallopeptidase [Gemmataceae bacterium]